MNTYKLVVSTPDGSVFDDEATTLVVRGTEGELAVMAGHIPFITAVKPGKCRSPNLMVRSHVSATSFVLSMLS